MGATDGRVARGWRLKTYFALLVTAFVAVAAVATTYVIVQSQRDGHRLAEHDARFVARTVAGQLGDAVAVLERTVAQLAATPQIAAALDTPEGCALTFAGPPGLDAGHIDILRADGSVACSSRKPEGKAALRGYAGEAWLRRALRGKRFEAPVIDAAVGGHAAISAAPIRGGVVAAFLALQPAGPELAELYGGGRPVVLSVLSGRRVLMRSIDPELWVGDEVDGALARRSGAVHERPDLDGRMRIFAATPVPGTDWTVWAGEDKAAALADGVRLRDRQLMLILAGLALVLVAAFLVYRRVALPVTRLGAAVRATGRLTPPEPVPVSGPAEVTALGEDVNGLIGAVSRELADRRRAEENYRLLFEGSPLPAWIYALDTLAVLEVNDAAVARYGWSREEFLALTQPTVECGPSRHRTRDGEEIAVRVIGRDVTFGDCPARLVMAEDVGERERLEDQLRQAQRMEALGRLAGGVAHDFNNLLTAIIGYSELMLAQMPAGDPRRGDAEEIKHAGERAVTLTRQLVTFGRGQALEPVVVDLDETVGAIEPLLRRLIREDVTIHIRPGDDVARIRADKGQIEQVLVNLAVNAGDAMPNGGRLTISTADVYLDEEYFRMHPAAQGEPGHHVLLEVADTGIGMDEETMSHVFEPFFSTKGPEHGTGLGLATVYGIVRQSRGSVWAYSEVGRGTTFKVYLPAVDAPVEAPAERRPAVLSSTGRTILVVEDDPAVRGVVRRMLEPQGFSILEAADGDAALALSATAEPGDVHVLLTDTVLPGVGGIELAGQIRDRHPGIRTILMSGYSGILASGELELGADSEFIAKPFNRADLYAKLDAVLDPS
jgi:two-component system cell cycle sensor histidine kinase/response regulator CckA